LGFPTGCLNTAPSSIFLAPLPGIEEEAPSSTTHQHFSGAVAGEKEDFYKGSLSRSTIYFVLFCFILFFTCIILSKTQKKLVFFIVVTSLLLVHYVVP
jgi:hypothetical protein